MFFPEQLENNTEYSIFNYTLESRIALYKSIMLAAATNTCNAESVIPSSMYQMDNNAGYIPISPSISYLRYLSDIKILKSLLPNNIALKNPADMHNAGLIFQLWLTKANKDMPTSSFCESHFKWTIFPYLDPTNIEYKEITEKKMTTIMSRRLSSCNHFICIVETTAEAQKIKDIITTQTACIPKKEKLSRKIKDHLAIKQQNDHYKKSLRHINTATEDLKKLTLNIINIQSDKSETTTPILKAVKHPGIRIGRFSSLVN